MTALGTPIRTCIGCRQAREKAALIRLVRDEGGHVQVDARGGAAGRGAYACPTEACVTKALGAGRLAHALRGASQPPPGGATVILEAWRRR
jgi:predicted RNA-binding protein YlxR (DUF448 family)